MLTYGQSVVHSVIHVAVQLLCCTNYYPCCSITFVLCLLYYAPLSICSCVVGTLLVFGHLRLSLFSDVCVCAFDCVFRTHFHFGQPEMPAGACCKPYGCLAEPRSRYPVYNKLVKWVQAPVSDCELMLEVWKLKLKCFAFASMEDIFRNFTWPIFPGATFEATWAASNAVEVLWAQQDWVWRISQTYRHIPSSFVLIHIVWIEMSLGLSTNYRPLHLTSCFDSHESCIMHRNVLIIGYLAAYSSLK